ncbi:hypothetical protein OKA04_09910 [Luteolibacter flavescens]|uniref:Ice-binding protein C-terminal domain-containing protein n=1 Tax=Luteolibacter flavescens TaxID=1859460 RepID=A0ABT3FN89_9BACT|nr:PEP-CTERM sorting domain-containing protein [Luteolibacter flavescens]MCW1885041.1 hypothetical protein [Luteolibacter flavescens]
MTTRTPSRLGLLSLIVSAALASAAQAAITFSGGGSDPITMTLTTDLVIPVTTTSNSTYSIGLLLPDVYSTAATGFARDAVNETYGTPGSITVTINLASGGSVPGYFFQAFGGLSSASGAIGVHDFYGGILLDSGPNLKVGDSITVKAGTLTFSSEFIRLPDKPIESIKIYNGNTQAFITAANPVPEPTAALLGGLGVLGLLRRRR